MNAHEQRHRSMHSDDKTLFSGAPLLHVQQAVCELCWLFDRGYARPSAIKLVGDHHQLSKRQRLAISRAACSAASRNARAAKCLPLAAIKNRSLAIDGFNLIITAETAIAGGLLLRCRDGCIRDLAGVHGTYRQVRETRQALYCIGQALEAFEPENVLWLFDAAVSNSGRLAGTVRNLAETHRWHWQAELTGNPDKAIIAGSAIAISSDSVILDEGARWVNLGAYLIERYFPRAWLLDLSNDLNSPEGYRFKP